MEQPEITGAQAQPNQQASSSQQQAVPQNATAPEREPQQDPVRDRTREQFDKLLESNQKLYEQNELLRKEMQDRLAAQQPVQTPQNTAQQYSQPTQQPTSEYDFYETDPQTGETYVNRDKLGNYLRDIQDKANRAEKTVQSYIKTTEEREIEKQNREAWSAHPELDPNNKDGFDNTLYKQVRGVLYDSMLNAADYGGRPLTYKEAADFVKGTTGNPTTSLKSAPEAQPNNSGAALKEASAAQVSSQHQQRAPQTDSDEIRALQLATRLGNSEALAQRLIHTEHILTRDAREV
jgi:hypothetical protein